jgi:hypothetical protein
MDGRAPGWAAGLTIASRTANAALGANSDTIPAVHPWGHW